MFVVAAARLSSGPPVIGLRDKRCDKPARLAGTGYSTPRRSGHISLCAILGRSDLAIVKSLPAGWMLLAGKWSTRNLI